MAWNPAQHGNITELIVPAKAIWQPKIFVYNSMDTKDMLTDEKYDARLRHTGEVKVNIPQVRLSMRRAFADCCHFH